MTFSEARVNIKNIVKKYFAAANVGYSKRSSSVTPQGPFVRITTGTPVRDLFPVERMANDRLVKYYQTRLPVQIDLFTNGEEGEPDENGFVQMEDTAVDDLTDFLDYLESHYVQHWCDRINASFTVNGDVQPLTGLVTDTDYQFRAMVELTFCFVHKAVGYAGIQGEDSIKHPGEPGFPGDTDPGEPQGPGETTPGTPQEPGETSPPEQPGVSPPANGDGSEPGYVVPDDTEDGVTVVPEYKPTSSGGRSEELVNAETGYFTKVKIEYKKEESNQ